MFKHFWNKLTQHKNIGERTNMTQHSVQIDLNSATEDAFASFTRVYKNATTGEIKTGPITLRVADISSVVPSNRLGKAKHRSTVTLTSGAVFDLSDVYSKVTQALAAA